MTYLLMVLGLFLFYLMGIAAWNLRLTKTWELAVLSFVGPFIILGIVAVTAAPPALRGRVLALTVLAPLALILAALATRLVARWRRHTP
jgi:hypothetical protein